MAGFFFAFAIDVAPAMSELDATAYVTTQQAINRVVRNATFGVTYFGSVLMPFLAAGAYFVSGKRRFAWAWLALAILYFGAVFWLTRTVNVPINDALATWLPSAPPGDWSQARATWNQSNLVRTVVALLCFVGALVLLSMSPRKAQ